jgi:hypothetical protein
MLHNFVEAINILVIYKLWENKTHFKKSFLCHKTYNKQPPKPQRLTTSLYFSFVCLQVRNSWNVRFRFSLHFSLWDALYQSGAIQSMSCSWYRAEQNHIEALFGICCLTHISLTSKSLAKFKVSEAKKSASLSRSNREGKEERSVVLLWPNNTINHKYHLTLSSPYEKEFICVLKIHKWEIKICQPLRLFF